MWVDYKDIRSRISEPPNWWLRGVPRYGAFSPALATVCANEVALVRTACQACGTRFDVAVENPGQLHGLDGVEMLALFADFWVGDPPNIGCCAGGASMLSDEFELLEFWESQNLNWLRRTELEGPLSGDFDNPKRRRPALDYAELMDVKELYFELSEQGNETALAALLARAGHEWPEIAARAAIKSRNFSQQRSP